MAIDRLAGSIQTTPLLPSSPKPGAAAAGGFTAAVAKVLDATETANAAANRAVADMVQGSGEVHDAMIALQRADISLQFTVQVRNKLVQAYQEIMRMPV
jgi:flagellar hook-basal body complex protein FliE